MKLCNVVWAGCMACAFVAGAAAAAEWGLKEGTADLKSAGPLAFGPDGILLVGDTKGAAVFALGTGDVVGEPAKVKHEIRGLNGAVAQLLGASPQETQIIDLAVNPQNGYLYLSVAHGPPAEAKPALVRIDAAGQLSRLGLEKIAFSKVVLPDAPEDKALGEGRRQRNPRGESITDLAYSDGKVLVSGLSNAAAPSTLREIPFPFVGADPGVSIEIYHGAHGRAEDNAPPRAFVPFNIDGEPSLLAGFTCTPLVKFPLASLAPGKKVRGTTVAELGNRNRPLDMIVYQKGGKSFLLMANSSRGVMKISTENIEKQASIEEPIPGGGTAGQPYETVKELQGVVQLDRLNEEFAVIIVETEDGSQDLRTIALP